jgi:type IV pilus assembly protein PilA
MPRRRLTITKEPARMTQWYYADDARNRIGPLSGDELREHYRQRRLRRDTLVWCEGMVQWLPLERVALELDIDSVIPDASVPPPMPTAGTPVYAAPRPAPKKQGMSGCLIAVLICAGLGIPMAGILAAIALPAYNDYVQRAKVMEVMAAVAPLKPAIAEHALSEGGCPDSDSADVAPLLQQLAQHPRVASVRVGTLQGGHCAFEVSLRGIGTRVDGKTLLFEAVDADASQWDCSGGDLDARFRPQQCRTTPTPT